MSLPNDKNITEDGNTIEKDRALARILYEIKGRLMLIGIRVGVDARSFVNLFKETAKEFGESEEEHFFKDLEMMEEELEKTLRKTYGQQRRGSFFQLVVFPATLGVLFSVLANFLYDLLLRR